MTEYRNISVDPTLGGDNPSDVTVSSQKAVKDYVDNNLPTKTSDLTNDSGYITGISSSDVTTALGYTPVPDTRTINGNALSSNITLTASDVGALPSSTVIPTLTYDSVAKKLIFG